MLASIGNYLRFAFYDCDNLRWIGRQRQSLRIFGEGVPRKILRPSVLPEGRPQDGQPTFRPTLPGPPGPHEFPQVNRAARIQDTKWASTPYLCCRLRWSTQHLLAG